MPSSADERPALVVSQSVEIRILLRGLLRLHRVREVKEAEGARETLDLLAEGVPRFVLLDSELSNGDVATLFDAIRERSPQTRIILVSRDPPPERVHPDALLQRPFRLNQFAQVIAESSPEPSEGRPAA
jgi:DNA-binding NtrC family response regulator